MPMTPELRRGIDRIRDYLFGGGYPNPAQNAEQLSFLIYFYMYEAADAARVRAASRPGAESHVSVFEVTGTCATHVMPASRALRSFRVNSCAGPPGRMRSTASGW